MDFDSYTNSRHRACEWIEQGPANTVNFEDKQGQPIGDNNAIA